MTRYFLFKYASYYPCGGFGDLTGIFESESTALAEIQGVDMWEDNADIYSLEDGDDRPELLYYKFSVIDESNEIWPVIGNRGKRIIRLIGKTIGTARWPESYRNDKMSNYKMEVE